MSEPESIRLGDLIDDYCPRCRLLLNHAVASMMESQVVKVICKTCYTEHAYRHGDNGKKKVAPRSTLFDQVLANAQPAEPEENLDEPRTPTAKKRQRHRRPVTCRVARPSRRRSD